MAKMKRRRRAVKAGYWGGLLLVLTGTTGAVSLIQWGAEQFREWSPGLADALTPIFLILLLVAALGGFSVILGAYVMGHHNRLVGKVLIALGSGVGLLLFALHIVLNIVSGANPFATLASMAITLQGLGVLLALYAQAVG